MASSSGAMQAKSLSWLMDELNKDLDTKALSDADRAGYLDQLKTHTRTPEQSKALCTKEGVSLLCRYSFDHGSGLTARTALKCLANIMLLAPNTRQLVADLDYAPKAAELIKNDHREDEFLGSRVLFLLTYGTNFDFNVLFTKHQLVESVIANVEKHAVLAKTAAGQKTLEEQMPSLALSDTLKLLFNLTQFYPDATPRFSKSLLPLLKLLHRLKTPSPPLDPPLAFVINAIMNLDLDPEILFPSFDPKHNTARLLIVLDSSLQQQTDEALEQSARPLLTLVRRVFEAAPKTRKTHLKASLLPSDKDREKPLGQSDSLASRLLKLSASPAAPNLSQNVQELLFELSDQDVQKFVRNIGYGFASGFLMSRGMRMPDGAMDAFDVGGRGGDQGRVQEIGSDEEDEDGDAAVSRGDGSGIEREGSPRLTAPVNPITGQRRDMEPPEEEDPRTEEERLREAERLFVLFERLRATGVVDIENPVATAAREGRLG